MNTRVFINLGMKSVNVEKMVFGHFCEHAFGNIYGGFYDPESPLSDEEGYRTDVLEAIKRVKPGMLRYPGGNFVSNYHWENGIGPKSERPRVFEYAWLTEEDNQFGTVDFIKICKKVNAEPYICVNMGSGTIEEAMNWVEYCNGTGNTKYANLRRAHGYHEPFKVKYWGLGNEAYGPWQMNHMSAEEYTKKAFEFAKAMKWIDPDIKLIACGYEQVSDWNYTVAKGLQELIDYISAHHYSVGWGPFNYDKYEEIMSISYYMERLNELTKASILAGLNDIKNPIKIAWDEWNLFGWQVNGVDDDARYTLKNAIMTATVLNMFIRHSDSIGLANYSTFVNINGAVSTQKDKLVLRAQYSVFDLLANNMGDYLVPSVLEGEKFEVALPKSDVLGRKKRHLNLEKGIQKEIDRVEIPYIDVTVTGNKDNQLFVSIINKHPDKAIDVDLFFDHAPEAVKAVSAKEIYHDDVEACNTADQPDNVKIQEAALPMVNADKVSYRMKKHSICLLTFDIGH